MTTSGNNIKRIAILFAGGPAPGANAVISSCALACLKHGIEVIGIMHGYSALHIYDAQTKPLREGIDYRRFTFADVEESRNARGIMIGTARANPGRSIGGPADLSDASKSAPLKRTVQALRSLNIDALVSIGGDDTLKTANKIYEYQRINNVERPIRVVHLPKTIDNDYKGIDFTFGYFTAVHWMASEVQNLLADAKAARAYFIVECMGRKAGWLSYGVAMAGEAQMILAVEDIEDLMKAANKAYDGHLDMDVLVDHIVDLVVCRSKRSQDYGVIVLAEGLAEKLPKKFLEETTRDEHGHISLGDVHLGHMVAKRVMARLKERAGIERKVNGVQLGYEARCAPPHAFDVMLGSQLGVGAYVALVEKSLDGVMVSTEGQLDLCFVPFKDLVDPATLVTEVRYIDTKSDFHRLATLLATNFKSKDCS
ncbi:MAG: 6-phosphofructokinase [Bradymonadales bacterium]|jgi:6-phosphofructokinase